MRSAILFSLMTVALLAGTACGDDSGTGGAGGNAGPCFDYGSFTADTPAVTFKADVLPILQGSCTFTGSCHGLQSGSSGRMYLGPAAMTAATDADIAEIFAQNVNVDATVEPGMKRVAPGDPERSFLMHKIDGTFECDVLTCGSSCGTQMPQGQSPLGADKADTIRRWIAQGAQNN